MRRRRAAAGRRTRRRRGEKGEESGSEEDEESVGTDEDEEDASPDSDASFERIQANLRDLLSSLPPAAAAQLSVLKVGLSKHKPNVKILFLFPLAPLHSSSSCRAEFPREADAHQTEAGHPAAHHQAAADTGRAATSVRAAAATTVPTTTTTTTF